jgi:hypothetical protein
MAFRSAASTTGANAASPGACNLPAGIQVGDYLLAFWSIDTADAAASATVPTGWTKISGPTNISGPDTQTYLIYERIADGNESTQRTWSGFGGNNFACIIAAWRERNISTPKTFITNSTPNTSANASPVSVALTGGTAAAGDDLAWFAALDNVSGASGWSLTSAPSGFTAYGVAQFQWGTAALAYRDDATAGATGTLTGTLTEAGDHAGWSGIVVAIAAASGSGTAGAGTPSYSEWSAAGAGSESTAAIGAPSYSSWSSSATVGESAAVAGAALYDAWSASGAVDGVGATDATGNASYADWTAAGATSLSIQLSGAPAYAGWSAAATGAESAAVAGAPSYAAWSVAGSAAESNTLAGVALYDAWSLQGFEVPPVAGANNLTAWHGFFGPTMLQ